MQIHQVQREHSNKTKKRVGRGGKRGKTSGRGMKGQKSRAGGSPRPEMRDRIKKLPKQRGHGKNRARTVNSSRVKYETVNLGALEKAFESGEKITPHTLLEKELVRTRGGKLPKVKVLGNGTLSKKFEVEKCEVSQGAKEKIEKAGGSIS